MVTDVRGDRVYVDPDWDHVDEGLAETLDWDEEGGPQYFEESAVTDVRNGQVHLRDDLF